MKNFKKVALVKLPTMQKGVVLLEALIAILIFSMGILALVGLQAAMIKNTTDNKNRADASFIAQQSIARMWADPANLANYACVDTTIGACGDIKASLPNGTQTIVVAARGLVTVTVTWQAPGDDTEHNYTTSTYIGA
jgi:type IV pilus assembly protein PilV